MEIVLPGSRWQFLWGISGLALGGLVAAVLYYISLRCECSAESSVQAAAASCAILAVLPIGTYLAAKRSDARLGEAGLIILGTVCVLLTAVYFFWAGFYVLMRADIFIWSESDFVNDILKYRAGYPIFTADVNNESFTYVPGAQLVTYFLAWLAGMPTSVPAYRMVQVLFTLLSAIAAFFCCRRLVSLSAGQSARPLSSNVLAFVMVPGLFLIAGNSLTNPFVHLLHGDALAQLVTVLAFWLLLEYETTNDKRLLWLMAVVPGLGFWVKQSLIIWAVLYLGYLLVFSRTRRIKTALAFAAAACGGVVVSYAIGYALWREDFTYWTFTVLGSHGVSPLRSFKHLLDVWIYFAIGLGAGVMLIPMDFRRLIGPWVIWLLIIVSETYTSGIAWMLNHIGPGSLIAGIWFFAALAIGWSKLPAVTVNTADAVSWLRAGIGVALMCLILNGLGVVRIPVRPFGDDAERYIKEIESEFAGQDPSSILLDMGTWVYLPHGVVMKDRAPTIGERGFSQTGDFSGILERLEQKHYRKILVRNLHSPDFWYDHGSWQRSSNIRRALLENYQEVRTIRAVEGLAPNEMPYGFNEISVLVPRAG